MVYENNHRDCKNGEVGDKSETRVHSPPFILDETERSSPHEEEIEGGEDNPSEEEVLMRLIEVAGLEREDGPSVSISVFPVSMVVDFDAREGVTRSPIIFRKSGESDGFWNKRVGDVGGDEVVEIGCNGRVVKTEVARQAY